MSRKTRLKSPTAARPAAQAAVRGGPNWPILGLSLIGWGLSLVALQSLPLFAVQAVGASSIGVVVVLDRFRSRLRQVHVSSLSGGHHVPLTDEDEERFAAVLGRCCDVPWILEARPPDRWLEELRSPGLASISETLTT